MGGVYWTKFECIADKVRRILTNDTCGSAARALLARGKTQKFPIIFICGSPHTPRREAEHLKGRKFLVLPPPLHSSKKANKCSLAFLPVLRPPFLRRLRRPEALPSPRSVVVRCPLTLRKHLALAARFAHDACSVLLRVRSMASAVSVVTLCACPTLPVRAQAELPNFHFQITQSSFRNSLYPSKSSGFSYSNRSKI